MIVCRNHLEFTRLTRYEQIQLINRDGHWLKYFDPIETELVDIISHNPNYIRYLKDKPSAEIQLLAVKKQPYTLRWLADPPREVIYEAIKQDPRYIAYIEHADYEWQEWIVNLNPEYLQYIRNPHPEIVCYAKLKM